MIFKQNRKVKLHSLCWVSSRSLALIALISNFATGSHATGNDAASDAEALQGIRWSHKGAVGLTNTTGSVNSLRTNFDYTAQRKSPLWDMIWETQAIYGEDDGVTSNQRISSRFQGDRSLSERWYSGLGVEFLHDSFAELDYRGAGFSTIGYRFFDNDDFKLRFEAGPGYLLEQRAGAERQAAAFRVGQFLDWQWSELTRVFQSLAYTGSFDQRDDHILTIRAGIESKLSGPWSLRLATEYIRYGASQAGAGREDFLTTLGIGYQYASVDAGIEGMVEALAEKKIAVDKWEISGLLASSFAAGNSESTSLGFGLSGRYRLEDKQSAFNLNGNYARNQLGTSAQLLALDAFTQQHWRRPWFRGWRLDTVHDDIADLRVRTSVSHYYGRDLYKSERSLISIELGPSAVFEDKGGDADIYMAVYANLKAERKLSANSEVFAEINSLTAIDNIDRVVVITRLGWAHRLSDRIKFKAVFRKSFDNNPALMRDQIDTQLVTGLEFEW